MRLHTLFKKIVDTLYKKVFTKKVKFSFSEKATNIYVICLMILTFALVNVKTIFMAFSEKLNFKRKNKFAVNKHFSPEQKIKTFTFN